MAKNALKYKNITVSVQPSERARLRVIGGPDAGSVFVISGDRVTIGRGEECEVAISDLKMSRRHAELRQTPHGFVIQDLGSANGLVVNGQQLKEWHLKPGDKVGLGTSVFEFFPATASLKVVNQQPERMASAVGTGASGLTQFIKTQASAAGALNPPAQSAPSASAAPAAADPAFFAKNRKLVISLGLLLAVAFLMPQAENQVRSRKKYQPPQELSLAASALQNYLPQVADQEIKRKSDIYFKEGFREYVEKNYLRARVNFDVALQIYPSNEMARRYITNIEADMKKEAEDHKRSAKIDEAANRKKSALNHYDAIRRLYFRDQTNNIYKEADEAAKALEKKISGGTSP